MSDAIAFLRRAIEQGQGLAEADLVLKGGRIFDLVSGELVQGRRRDLQRPHRRHDGRYTGAPRDRRPRQGDRSGLHRHPLPCRILAYNAARIRSLRAGAWRDDVRFCDPHEIANVLGSLACAISSMPSMLTAMDLRVQLSSCVPATALETSGARLRSVGSSAASPVHPKVLGLAEFMNFPGVLARDPSCLAKLAAFQTRRIDGHSPLLSGAALNGYLSAGVRTDHEVTNLPEARSSPRECSSSFAKVRCARICTRLAPSSPSETRRSSPSAPTIAIRSTSRRRVISTS